MKLNEYYNEWPTLNAPPADPVERIKAMWQELEQTFLRTPLTSYTIDTIGHRILDTLLRLAESYPDGNSSEVRVGIRRDTVDQGSIIVLPYNLYAALLLNGQLVPYNQVVGKTSFETSIGTFKLNKETYECDFTPIEENTTKDSTL